MKINRGMKIFWRWKKTKASYLEATIEDINGNMITFEPWYHSSRSWLDIKELDIKVIKPQDLTEGE